MTTKEAKAELNRMVREAERADYVSEAELDRMIYLTKIVNGWAK